MKNYTYLNNSNLKYFNVDLKSNDNFDLLIKNILDNNVDNRINYIYLKKQDYKIAWKLQKHIHKLVQENILPDIVLFLEHNHVYTFGKNANEDFLLDSYQKNADVVKTDRGGQVTYHGPGQLVGYPIINLNFYKKSITWFMRTLEQTIINTLLEFKIQSNRKDGYPGVWIEDEKICAMGVRISRWVTMHGFALNVNPDMSYFDGMIPCGILNHGITSLKKQLNKEFSNKEIINVLMSNFNLMFKRAN